MAKQFNIPYQMPPIGPLPPAADASGRVTVYKGGKPFTVPASQKDDAVKAGYSLTQ